jgi:hypothetical protein
VIKGGDKELQPDVDLEQTLKEFRELLAKKISSSDFFAAPDNAKVDKINEEKTKVKQIARKEQDKENTYSINIIKESNFSLSDAKAQVPQPGKTAFKPDKITTSEATQESKFHEGVPKIVNSPSVQQTSITSKNDNINYYLYLTDLEKEKCLTNLQLFRGITINNESFFSRTNKELFNVDIKEITPTKPSYTTYSNEYFSFSKDLHEVIKFGAKSFNVKAGVPFFGISSQKTDSQENQNLQESQEIYMLYKYGVRKIALSMNISNLIVSSNFVQEIQQLEGQTVDNYNALLTILDDYGYYISPEVVLGAELSVEDTKKLMKTKNLDSIKKEFSIDAEASFSVSGVPVTGGIGYGNKNENQETKILEKQTARLKLVAKGGDPGTVRNVNQWLASLGSFMSWEIIEYKKLIPSINLLPMALQSKCINLTDKFCTYKSALKNKIDMKEYILLVQSINASKNQDLIDG